jgi:hypothetical protein
MKPTNLKTKIADMHAILQKTNHLNEHEHSQLVKLKVEIDRLANTPPSSGAISSPKDLMVGEDTSRLQPPRTFKARHLRPEDMRMHKPDA